MNKQAIDHAIHHNQIVQLTVGVFPSWPDPVRCFIRKQSKRTGGLTVELAESFGAYLAGAKIHVKPYEVERKTPRLTELQAAFASAHARCVDNLNDFIKHGRDRRQKFSDELTKDIMDPQRYGENVDLLVEGIKSSDIKADVLATMAARAIYTAREVGDVAVALRAMRERCREDLMSNRYRGTSSCPVSNAIDSLRMGAIREFFDFCDRWVERLAEVRAELEVL